MSRYAIARRTILVTGAASGIGAALAEELSMRGADLALVDREAERLDAVMQHVTRHGGKVSRHVADLADLNALAGLEEQVLTVHGGIAGLINNAGVAMFGDFEQIAPADFDWLMRINFQAPMLLTRMFLPHLRRAPDAVIVNMSSIFGIVAPAGQSAYCASKFALRGFSEALMHELAGTSLRVVTVHPGGIRTSIVDNARVSASFSPSRATTLARRFNRAAPTTSAAAARQIVGAMVSGKQRLLIGPDARLLDWMQRLAPLGYWDLMRRMLALKDRGAGGV